MYTLSIYKISIPFKTFFSVRWICLLYIAILYAVLLDNRIQGKQIKNKMKNIPIINKEYNMYT